MRSEQETKVVFKNKGERGAISIFVVVTVLTFVILLIGGYLVTLTLQKSQLESDIRIKEVYGGDVNRIDEIYEQIILRRGDTTPQIEYKMYQTDGKEIAPGGKYEQIAITLKIPNKNELGAIDEIVLKNSKGEFLTANAVVIGDETADLTFLVDKNGKYIASVKATTYGEQRTSSIEIVIENNLKVEGVIIPDGFYYVGGTKDEGIVISTVEGDNMNNTKGGNQFVWVPVDDFSEFVRHDFGKKGKPDSDFISTELTDGKYYEVTPTSEVGTSCTQETKDEVTAMYRSVEQNHGFYIARYEAGKENINGKDTLVIKKNATVWNNIAWSNSDVMTVETGGAVELARKMYPKNNGEYGVTSTLVYGVQWDAVMRWISKDTSLSSYLTDSTGKGNYSDEDDTNNPAPTGSNDSYQLKNIYDMAGNCCELTMEARETNYRVFRGRRLQGFGF